MHCKLPDKTRTAFAVGAIATPLACGAPSQRSVALSKAPLSTQHSTTVPTAILDKSWPDFSGRFVERTPPETESERGTNVTWDIIYRGPSDWEMTVVAGETLGDQTVPGGGWAESHPLPGSKMIMSDGALKWVEPNGEQWVLTEGPNAPNEWLQPRYSSSGWLFTADNGAFTGSRIEEHPCGQGSDECTFVSEVRLNNQGIPTHYVHRVEGEVTKEATVLSLTILD